MELARKRLRPQMDGGTNNDNMLLGDGDIDAGEHHREDEHDEHDDDDDNDNNIEDRADVGGISNNNRKIYKVDPSLIQKLDYALKTSSIVVGEELDDQQVVANALAKKCFPNVPHLPSWAVAKYSDYAQDQQQQNRTPPELSLLGISLSSLPQAVQELALLEDLLFVMIGIDGKYIHTASHISSALSLSSDIDNFLISSEIDPTFKKLVTQILPISSHYLNVHKYVTDDKQFNAGLVSHATCSAINTFLKEYLMMVAQLETQLRQNKLTLQKLWFYIQNNMKTMALLDHVTTQARRSGASGGALLNLLYNVSGEFASTYTGPSTKNDSSSSMFLILKHAAVPYLDMLGLWIFKGKIDDPYREFMVEEHMEQQKENLNDDVNDAYWEQKYTLRENQVPIFLEKIADKILVTGKYLNVMTECGREVKFQNEDMTLIYTGNHNEYIDKIEWAYDMASRKLLDLLCNELDLLNRLRSIKRYFLLDQGDFFTHFMDISLEELQKPTCDISKGKLKSLLELSLRTSSVADIDIYKDDLGIEFHPYTLLDMLLRIIHVAHGSIFVNPIKLHGSTNDTTKGLELFTFSYHVQWPLSLIISRKVLIKYQLIFRQLSLCKNVELQLSNEWILSMNAKFAPGFQPASGLRHKMVHFLQNFQYYMMVEVIEPNWHKFEAAFRKVRTVDEVLKIHTDFVDSCLHECMLTDPRLVRILMKLMAICEAFADVIKRLMNSIMVTHTKDNYKRKGNDQNKDIYKGTKSKSKQPEKVISQPIFDTSLQTTIKSVDEHFKYHLHLLLEALKSFSTTGESNHFMIHLLTRLDYNGFYSQYFAAHPAATPQKR